MRNQGIPSSLRRTPLLVPPLTLAVLLVSSCGEQFVPCNPCPEIAGVYEIESSHGSGECDFQPLLLTGSFELEQSADNSEVFLYLRDSITNEPLELNGEVYAPIDRDPPDALANLSMSTQVVRPALPDSPHIMTARITMSGLVKGSQAARTIDGVLRTSDASPGEGPGCQVGIVFSASTGEEVPE